MSPCSSVSARSLPTGPCLDSALDNLLALSCGFSHVTVASALSPGSLLFPFSDSGFASLSSASSSPLLSLPDPGPSSSSFRSSPLLLFPLFFLLLLPSLLPLSLLALLFFPCLPLLVSLPLFPPLLLLLFLPLFFLLLLLLRCPFLFLLSLRLFRLSQLLLLLSLPLSLLLLLPFLTKLRIRLRC